MTVEIIWAVVIVVLCGVLISGFLIWRAAAYKSSFDAVFGGLCAVLTIAGLCVFIWWCNASEEAKRTFKELESDLNGGLERTVTLYSYDGDKIDSWTGKFDVSSSETETYFDIDGKRVIIHGGIVVNEEAE